MADDTAGPGPGHNSGATTKVGGVSADRLKSFVERVERLKEEIAGLNTDVSDIYKEAESGGFDKKALKEVIRRRAMDDVENFDGLVATYEHAIDPGTAHARARTHEGDPGTTKTPDPVYSAAEGAVESSSDGDSVSSDQPGPGEGPAADVEDAAGDMDSQANPDTPAFPDDNDGEDADGDEAGDEDEDDPGFLSSR